MAPDTIVAAVAAKTNLKNLLLKILQKTVLYHALFFTIKFGNDADVAIVCLICRHT